MLPATHLTRPTRAGNKPSRRLITEKSSPARRPTIVTRHRPGPGNSAPADNARDRPRAAGCTEHPGMRKQLLTGTNSISAPNGGSGARSASIYQPAIWQQMASRSDGISRSGILGCGSAWR